MSSGLPDVRNRTRPSFGIVVACGLLVLGAAGVLGHDLWTPDEPRVGAISAEVARGAWIVPTLNGTPFLEKPPLYFWSVALVYRAFGSGAPEIGRVVSALYALGMLCLTFLLARDLARLGAARDEDATRIGVLAALSLGLSAQFLLTAHRVVVDSALAFFTTASVVGLLRGLTLPQPGRRLAWLAAAYACASLAFMAKGPVGPLVMGLALLALALALRDRSVFARAQLWLAPLCFCVIAGPWLWLLYRELGEAGYRELFVGNLWERVLTAGSHDRPVYYYALELPGQMAPATLFVLGAVVRRFSKRALPGTARVACDFGLIWLGLGLAVLSLPSTKRAVYLLPFYPAAAIAAGSWLSAWLEPGERDGYERFLCWALVGLTGVLAAALPVAAWLLEVDLRAPLLGALGVGVLAAATAQAARTGLRARVLVLTLGACALTVVLGDALLAGPVDQQKSLRLPSEQIAAAVPRDQPVYALKPDETTEAMLPLYTGRPIVALPNRASLEQKLASGEELYVVVVLKSHRGAQKARAKPGRLSGLAHEVVLDYSAGPIARRFQVLHFGPRASASANGAPTN